MPLTEHDKPFKPANPAKSGRHATIEKFPEYVYDPVKPLERRYEDEDAPKKFRPTHNSKTRPTPSVTTNLRNLKASFPTMFVR